MDRKLYEHNNEKETQTPVKSHSVELFRPYDALIGDWGLSLTENALSVQVLPRRFWAHGRLLVRRAHIRQASRPRSLSGV